MYTSRYSSHLVALALAVILASPVNAHEAHVHGLATMDVAVGHRHVTAQLASPLANLIGFEHRPTTDEERQAVRTMASQLRQANAALVTTPEAQCTMIRVSLSSPNLPAQLLGEQETEGNNRSKAAEPPPAKDTHTHKQGQKPHHKQDQKQKQNQKQSQKQQQDHKQDHKPAHNANSGHANLDATFVFDCTNMQELQYIDVPLLTAFTGINRLDVQLITPTRQQAATLNAGNFRIQLK